MANKREFKKFVTAVGSNVIEDMMLNYYTIKDINKDAVDTAIGKVLDAIETARCNANVFFDKGTRAFETRKEYTREKERFFRALFDKIASDFEGSLEAAVKEFNDAVPQSVKDANKKALAD